MQRLVIEVDYGYRDITLDSGSALFKSKYRRHHADSSGRRVTRCHLPLGLFL